MQDKLVLVFDCGATNVRVIAVSQKGTIVAKKSVPNNVQPDPFLNHGLIWDIEEIWLKLVQCAKDVISKVSKNQIVAITITTFGVNGAAVDKRGKLLYPVISWQCQRTVPIMESIDKYIKLEQLYRKSGINKFSFNTINTLIWFKQNRPDLLDKMEGWLFIPSIFVHKLTGKLINDTTMLGTSMVNNYKTRNISKDILESIGFPSRFFEIAEPGTNVGSISREVSKELGLNENVKIILAGHDTQFAIFGSGAEDNDAVLSSGTWEILMTRSKKVNLTIESLNNGVTNEFDAIPGLYNSGIQWMASGILEWIKQLLYQKENNLPDEDLYKLMINEAFNELDNPTTIHFDAEFLNREGIISGLGTDTTRGQIYLSALRALTEKTYQSLNFLEQSGNFKAKKLTVVGGGSKNTLWNQLRANRLKIPVRLIEQTETTVLGAALFAFSGIGFYRTPYEARKAFNIKSQIIEPNVN